MNETMNDEMKTERCIKIKIFVGIVEQGVVNEFEKCL